MSKKEKFVNVIETLFNKNDLKDIAKNDYDDVITYWKAFKGKEEIDKPLFTDNGKLILQYMKDTMPTGKARDIAEGLFISSRTVSGSMRKLVSDGYVEKLGQEPTIYSITDKGKTIEIK